MPAHSPGANFVSPMNAIFPEKSETFSFFFLNWQRMHQVEVVLRTYFMLRTFSAESQMANKGAERRTWLCTWDPDSVTNDEVFLQRRRLWFGACGKICQNSVKTNVMFRLLPILELPDHAKGTWHLFLSFTFVSGIFVQSVGCSNFFLCSILRRDKTKSGSTRNLVSNLMCSMHNKIGGEFLWQLRSNISRVLVLEIATKVKRSHF